MLSLPPHVNQNFPLNFGRDRNFQRNPSPLELERRAMMVMKYQVRFAQCVLRSFELEMDQFRALF